MPTIPPQTLSRFLAKVDVPTDPDDCWLWTAKRFATGYGAFSVGGRSGTMVRAHRFAYEAFVGPIPEGLNILHACDVRHCVNPRHLRPGTRRENVDDAVTRGRMAAGDRNGMRRYPERHGLHNRPELAARGERANKSRLTDADVRDIRRAFANGVRQADLATRYGVSQPAISAIVQRKTWDHVADS